MAYQIAQDVLEVAARHAALDQRDPVLSIHLQSDGPFAAQQELLGTVCLSLDFDLPVRGVSILFEGYEKAYGSIGADGRFGEVFEQTRSILKEEKTLFGKTHLPLRLIAKELLQSLTAGVEHSSTLHTLLPKGQYQWKFSFILPADAPPDFSSRYGSEIVYRLHARVDVPFGQDIECNRAVSVFERHDPDLPKFAPKDIVKSAEKEFLFEHKPLRLKVHLSANCVQLGDVIDPIEISISNESNKCVKSVRITLLQQETTRPEHETFVNEVEVTRKAVTINDTLAAPTSFRTNFAIPRNIYPSIYSAKLITVAHLLRVTALVPWHTGLSVDLPIILSDHPASVRPAKISSSNKAGASRTLPSRL